MYPPPRPQRPLPPGVPALAAQTPLARPDGPPPSAPERALNRVLARRWAHAGFDVYL
jgi:hypothetical protein